MVRLSPTSLSRVVCFAAALIALVVPSSKAHAGGAVLAPAGTSAPAIAIRMAIAPGPTTTTRWSEVTLPAGPALGWLVPVRPGAIVEWAPAAWLESLDDASAPRILVPRTPDPCSLHQSFEQPRSRVEPAAGLPSSTIARPATAAAVESWAAAHGLSLGTEEAARVRALYASGWQVAASLLAAANAPRTSATLRVTDDGGAVLPLSIGAPSYATSVTLFVVGAGNAALEGMREINDASLEWGALGSSYTDLRDRALGSKGWLRESSSHAALFDEVPVTATESISSVVATYFGTSDCAAEVVRLGAGANVAPADSLACDDQVDLALALAGIAPASAVLTRIAGVLPVGGAVGTLPVTVAPGSTRSPVRTATGYDHACPIDVDPGAETSSSSSSGGIRYPGKSPSSPGGSTTVRESSSDDTTVVYVPSDGCGGGTTAVESSDDTSSTDSCSSDGSSSSDGWDSSDSSGDDCSSSSSDGWDSSDGDCTAARAKKRRGPSRFSRGILLAVALLLPLRRLSRRPSRQPGGERP